MRLRHAGQILPAAVPPFLWLLLRPPEKGIRAFDSCESLISILQGNRPQHPETRQNPDPRFAQMSPPITAFCGFSRSTICGRWDRKPKPRLTPREGRETPAGG